MGADNAWRGFMLQALYIGDRVSRCEEDAVYMPETVEDLAVVSCAGGDDERIELVQVKSKQSDALSLSHLKPKKPTVAPDEDDSFLGHLWRFWSQGFEVSARVVSFGEVGQELASVSENLREGRSLRKKLVEGHGYDDGFCDWLATHLEIDRADETALSQSLRASLGEHAETAAAAELAENYVKAYMYDCCRNREHITPGSWRERLAAFGVQAASARGYLANYGQTIVPLSEYLSEVDSEELRGLERSYRAGAAAVPQHIVLGLDIERPRWQEEIGRALVESNVAVVRAASGQGKSTACYRWLMDNCATGDVYLLTGIMPDNAAGVASALRGLAKTGEGCLGYVEADSGEGWVALCAEVNRLGRSGLRLLVSVREDDAARAGYFASDVGARDVFMRFDNTEAKGLFARSQTALFPNFEAAWECFGGGPLMEFTYSLDHEVGLRAMLEGQAAKIRQTGDEGWLEFLYLASRAGEYGLASSIPELVDASGCRNPQRMLGVLEDELLLRSDSERGVVIPLHPYRSMLLAEAIAPMLYEDEEALTLKACRCACGDFGPVLVQHLYEHDLGDEGMAALVSLAGRSWTSSACALRAMVWKDARSFLQSVEGPLSEISGQGLPVTLGAILSGAATEKAEPESWEYLLKLIGDGERRARFGNLVASLSGRVTAFEWTDRFLAGAAAGLPPVSMCADQPHDAGFVLAYIGERGFSGAIATETASRLAGLGFGDMALEGALDLVVGLSCAGIPVSEDNRASLLGKVCQRDCIVWLNADELVEKSCLDSKDKPYGEVPVACLGEGGLVKQLSAIVAPNFDEADGDAGSKPVAGKRDMSPNSVVMRAACDLRRLYPNRGRYCVRYVGIKALVEGLEIPDCEKHIPERNLRLNWLKLVNRYYLAMCGLIDSPASDWADLRRSVEIAMADSADALRLASELVEAVVSRSEKIGKKQKAFVAAASRAKEELDSLNADLPVCARDPYGFGTGQLRAFAHSEGGDPAGLEAGEPAYGEQKGGAAILPVTKNLAFQLQTHFNRINEMILYAAGKAGRPEQVVVYVIAEACALIEGSERELSAMFGQEARLFSKGQKEALLQHAAYWNHVWSHGSTGKGHALLLQRARVSALENFGRKLRSQLSCEPGVASAELTGGILSVECAIGPQVGFSSLFARCLREALGFDLHEGGRLFELCTLRDSDHLRIEVFFTYEGKRLLRKEYKLAQMVDNLASPERVDSIVQAELLFDEGGPRGTMEAEITAQVSMNTCERLMGSALELVEAFGKLDPNGRHIVMTEWASWREAALGSSERMCDQLEVSLRLLPGQDTLEDELAEFRSNIRATFGFAAKPSS